MPVVRLSAVTTEVELMNPAGNMNHLTNSVTAEVEELSPQQLTMQ